MEAGSKIASAMKDVINAAAGLTGFAVESARDLVQYMIRRGQMTPDEGDRLMREVEEAHSRRQASGGAHHRTIPVAHAAELAPVAPAAVPVRAQAEPAVERAPAAKKAPAKPAAPAKSAKPAAKPARTAAKTAGKAAKSASAKKAAPAARAKATKTPVKSAASKSASSKGGAKKKR
ncbi:MAG TPA: hypothetical protein VFS05_02860 [Gemmatimonadaceae bacterium]|nr:hypothetical protein [Gemmatimonadaceae bacterium]